MLTEETLVEYAGQRSFDRGEDYYEKNLVSGLIRDGDMLAATVQGSYDYQVKLWIEDHDLYYSCTCPVGERGEFCKHCVAVGLQWLYGGSEKSEVRSAGGRGGRTMDDVRNFLEGREKGELIDMVVKLAMSDQDLRESLLLKASAVSPEGVDVASISRALDNALTLEMQYDERYDYDYEGEPEAFDTKKVDRALDALSALVDAGHGAVAMDLSEHALRRIEKELSESDYEIEDTENIIGQIESIHHAACFLTKLDPCGLAQKLFKWTMSSERGVFANAVDDYSDVLGEDGIACYQELAEKEWNVALAEDDLDGHYPILHIMELLASRTGDTEAVVRIMSEDLSSADRYLRIAGVYRDVGQADAALEWVERVTDVFPGNRVVMEVLKQEYWQRGRYHDVLRLVWIGFRNNPSLSAYQNLKQVAEQVGEWLEWREKALDRLNNLLETSKKSSGQWYYENYSSLLVEIYLWEQYPEAALEQARRGGCTDKLWQQIAERIADTRPQDAIDIYKKQIEDLIEDTNNDAYSAAVRLLHKLGALMGRNGWLNEFEEYRQSLRKNYYRKRNFVRLLDSARW